MLITSKIKRFAKKALKVAGVTAAIVAAGTIGLHIVRANAASNYNCDNNAVVYCGAKSSTNAKPATVLANKYFNGDGHNSTASIHNIYSWFKITSSDITYMKGNAVSGSVTSGGNVYVNGTLVASNVLTAGRQYIKGSTKRVVNGTTFYTRAPSVSFLQGSLAAEVVMKNGVFQFALLNSCGNPVSGTPKKPNYSILKQVRAGTSGSYSSNVTVKSGSTVQYQITVQSTGAVPVTNVTVHDTLPKGISYHTGTLSENGTAVSSVNASKFFGSGLQISSIKNGSKVVFTFTATAGSVSATAASCKPGTMNNEGYISAPGLQNQQSGAKVNVTCTPPVALQCTGLSAAPGSIDLTNGDQQYTLTATASAENVTINRYDFVFGDGKTQAVSTSALKASASPHTYTPGTYHASVTITATAGGKTYSATCKTQITVRPAPAAACESLQAIVSDRSNVALTATASADNGATISGYNFTVKDAGGTVIANPNVPTTNTKATTNVVVTNAGVYTAAVAVATNLGVKTSNACVTHFTITPPQQPGVTITKYVDNVKLKQVQVNQDFTYELKVTNTGNTDLQNVAVTDPAPQGVTMLSSDLGTISGNALNYTIPTLKVGTSVSFNITAKVTAYQPGDIVNTACVNAPAVNPSQPTKPDACDTATVTVTPPGVTITKTVDGKKLEQVNVNQNFVYQLVITNTGDVALDNVVVSDPAPQGVTMLSTDTGTISGNALNYTIPSLAIGAHVTINITAEVTAYQPGDIVNTACVNAPAVNPSQPTKPDACDTATVTVTPPLPPAMPNTGAGDTIGLFAGVVVAGTLGYRLFLGRKLVRQ